MAATTTTTATITEIPNTSSPVQIPNFHLGMLPNEIICPSCNVIGETVIKHEPATFIQRTVAIFEKCCCCKCHWRCARDINHYCSNCGCFIGRFIELGYFQEHHLKRTKKLADKSKLNN